jgi:hypothetical protein
MPVLVELDLLDAGTGTRVKLRLTDANDARVTTLDDKAWIPAVGVPSIAAESYFDGNFQQAVARPSATFTASISAIRKHYPTAMALHWEAAPVCMWHGKAGQPFAQWHRIFTGRVTDFPTVDGNFNIKADAENSGLASNVLTRTYTGGGGNEGTIDLTGRPKPWLAGKCLNVEPIAIDQVYNVHQFHGYGPILAVDDLLERGSSFGPSLGNYPSYAALVAATVPEGRWATCLAEGMIRLGAPPAGVITGDVRGDNPATGFIETTGAVLMRIMANAGMTTADYSVESFTALDADLSSWPNQGRIGLFISGQETVENLAARMVAPCNAVAQVEAPSGQLVVRRIGIGATSIVTVGGEPSPRVVHPALPSSITVEGTLYQDSAGNLSQYLGDVWQFGAPVMVHEGSILVSDGFVPVQSGWNPLTVYSAGDRVEYPAGSGYVWLYVGADAAGSEPGGTSAAWMRSPVPTSFDVVLDAQGGSKIPVSTCERLTTSAPYHRIEMGAVTSWRVHSADELATEYRWRGAWSALNTYSNGDIVSHLDGSTWRFVHATPLSGSEPSDTNAHWARESSANYLAWSGVADDNGLRPEDNADITRVLTISPQIVNLRAKVDGELYSQQLPVIIVPKFTKSGVLSNAAENWTFSASSTITAAQDTTSNTNEEGRVTISAVTAGGTVSISTNGLTQICAIEIVRDQPAPVTIINTGGSGGGSSGITTSSITAYPSVTLATYPSAPPETRIVTAGPSGSVQFNSFWEYAQGIILAGKHVYRVAGSGGAWIDVAGESIGNAGTAGTYDPVNGDWTPAVDGYVSFSATLSLTPDTDYEWGVLLRRWSSSGSTSPFGQAIGRQV